MGPGQPDLLGGILRIRLIDGAAERNARLAVALEPRPGGVQ